MEWRLKIRTVALAIIFCPRIASATGTPPLRLSRTDIAEGDL
jgi:hypothetical protein